MGWLWNRSQPDKSDRVAEALLGVGTEASEYDIARLATVEACASMWARALAAATVSPGKAADILGPDALAMIGRELFLQGEIVFTLDVVDGRLVATPTAGRANVTGGGSDSANWRYQVTTVTPSGSESRWLQASDVLHFRYGPRANVPFRGVSPLTRAGLDAGALAALTKSIGQEANAPSGTVVTHPGNPNSDWVSAFQKSLSNLQGRTRVTVDDRARNPQGNVAKYRIGFQPDAEARPWASDLEKRVMAAAGMSPALLLSETDGTASREAFRRFSALVVGYLASIVSTEATRKLETPVSLGSAALRGSDSQGLGRAVKSLVDSGMSLAEALKTVGLD